LSLFFFIQKCFAPPLGEGGVCFGLGVKGGGGGGGEEEGGGGGGGGGEGGRGTFCRSL